MTKLPALKAKEAISALEKLGFQMDHVTSRIPLCNSHDKYHDNCQKADNYHPEPVLYTHLITLNSFIITGQNNHPLPKKR
jgi:hypothetical protein